MRIIHDGSICICMYIIVYHGTAMNHACVCVSFYATLSFSRNFDVLYNDQRELYNNKGAQHHGLVLLHLCTYRLYTITLCVVV